MRKIAISCTKGGVGKTTTAVNLAAGLAMAGRRVLLVEADAQDQVCYMLGLKPETGLRAVVLGEQRPHEALMKARAGLWILAGGPALDSVNRVIAKRRWGWEWTLLTSLAPLEGRFDYVILDTSAGWHGLTISSILYAEDVLVPVSLEAMAVQTLLEFQRNVAGLRKYHNKLTLRYIVPTFSDGRVKKSGALLSSLQRYYGERMCSPIRYNVKLSEAPALGKTIYEYAPRSRGAEDYARLAQRIVQDE